MFEVKFKRLRKEAILPKYSFPGDACFDLHSCIDAVIDPGDRKLIPTGWAVEFPYEQDGFQHYFAIMPRSGLAYKHKVTLGNNIGVLDSGYRNECGVILINHGNSPFKIDIGDRIAQATIHVIRKAELVEVDELSETERNMGGIGSTGVK